MQLDELKLIARERGIKTRNRKKDELIRDILEGEGAGDSAGEPTDRPAANNGIPHSDRQLL